MKILKLIELDQDGLAISDIKNKIRIISDKIVAYHESIISIKEIPNESSDGSIKKYATEIILTTNKKIYVAESVAYIDKLLAGI